MADEKDIVPGLLKDIEKQFEQQYSKDKEIKSLLDKLDNKTATYLEANDYSIRTAEILNDALNGNINSEILPNRKMYYNIADRILNPTLHKDYELVSDYCNSVQKALNQDANLGMNPVIPKINQNRIDGIIDKVSNSENYYDISEFLNEAIVNFSQSTVTDYVRENADFQYKSGMQPKIIREVVGGCCEWCGKLAGTYNYEAVSNTGNNVFRRHRNCRCTVSYVPKDGKVQNVHTKRYIPDAEKIEFRKRVGLDELNSSQVKDVTKEYIRNANPGVGNVTLEENYYAKDHEDEIKTAEWIKNTFGGNITLLKEIANEYRCDFLWNGVQWEFKQASSMTSIDTRIRKALKQLNEKYGGILLDVSNSSLTDDEVIKYVTKILKNRHVISRDMIVRRGNKVISVLRC